MLRESQDQVIKGRAFHWSGIVSIHVGDYDNAMTYLHQALAIFRALGDRAGLCETLFNIGNIHRINEEPQQALASWVAAYRIAREIGLAEALQNLDNLAKQLGGPGMQFWEMLARQLPVGKDGG